MPSRDISGTTAVVTGASRGFGRAITVALADAGAQVVGVARDRARLDDLCAELGDRFVPVVADASTPTVAGLILDQHQPRTLVLNPGAVPLMRPLQHHTWQTFSRAWDVDVQHVFRWVREALLIPLAPGAEVVSLSSGAALGGSPLSGGYAGAKATIRFISAYAAAESDRNGLGIRFTSVLPTLTPATDMGAAGVAAYARSENVDIADFLERRGPALLPDQVGKAVVELVTAPASPSDPGAYVLSAAGLTPAP